MDVRDETFRNCTVQLDDISYNGCVFEDVTFEYAGTSVDMVGCTIRRPKFRLVGALGNGLATLGVIARSAGPGSVKSMADGVAALVRKLPDKKTFDIG